MIADPTRRIVNTPELVLTEASGGVRTVDVVVGPARVQRELKRRIAPLVLRVARGHSKWRKSRQALCHAALRTDHARRR